MFEVTTTRQWLVESEGSCSSLYDRALPRPGRAVGTLVERLAVPLRAAVESIFDDLSEAKVDLSLVLRGLTLGPGCQVESECLRAAWALSAIALVHAAVKKSHNLCSSISWFFPDCEARTRIEKTLSLKSIEAMSAAILVFKSPSDIHSLLPYVLEQHGHVTRRTLECSERGSVTRESKRAGGVFYTPLDVANFLVAELSRESDGTETWCDPACGTGVFLRAALAQAFRSPATADGVPTQIACSVIFGMDASALAIEMASLVLVLECCLQKHKSETSPSEQWSLLKANFVCMDALQTFCSRDSLSSRVPLGRFKDAAESGFARIIMNPPYAVQKIPKDVIGSWDAFNGCASQSGPIQLAFVEMMWRLTSTIGLAAAVLPLSIATNSQTVHRRFRNWIAKSSGTKEFLFFDREPQSLFGEDVKTRNAILFLRKGGGTKKVFTSSLLKWTAAQRNAIFGRGRLVETSEMDGPFGIPKLGSSAQVAAYCALRSSYVLRQSSSITGISYAAARELTPVKAKSTLLVGSTAYNFVNCFSAEAILTVKGEVFSQSFLHSIDCSDRREAMIAYALLTSRICYWLWRVEGDGFHLSRSFITNSPLWAATEADVSTKLAQLGERMWKRARETPQRSVNAGRATISFEPDFYSNESKSVEAILLRFFGIDLAFSSELDAFIDSTVSVDGQCRSRLTKELEETA